MTKSTRKTERGTVDGTPEKRMFWSIISDYDLKTGLCELVDNALDTWMIAGKKRPLRISIDLDATRQIISVKDNAGGVKEDELALLVSPGGSRNDANADVIGIFGVGSKRAGIALGERVEIRTRYRNGQTYQLDVTRDWLESNDWRLAKYAVTDIEPNTTRVDISHLRKPFSDQDVKEIRAHLGETYSWFLSQGCEIKVNKTLVQGHTFEKWAFPREHSPAASVFPLELEEGTVNAGIVAGLIYDRVAEADNYGVYFYCNHRLIVKELRVRLRIDQCVMRRTRRLPIAA